MAPSPEKGTPGDDEHIAELIHRMQVYAYPRRIRISEFFLNFDKLKCGRVTKAQFGRALNTGGFKISDVEADLLADHFTQFGPNVSKPQVVNYTELCAAVEKVFNDGDLSFNSDPETNQMAKSQDMSAMTAFKPREVHPDRQEHLDHLLHRLATLCTTRGVCWNQIYFDYDRGKSQSPALVCPRRSGRCNPNQFKRAFPFKGDFTPDDIQLLVDRYTTDANDVHFQAMHEDISEVITSEPPPFPTSPLYLKPDHTVWEHQKLNPVRKLQCKVAEKRIRLKERFLDFDPLRKGFCTPGQFKTVLTVCDLQKDLTTEGFKEVVAAYSRDDGMVCYALFVKDIDAIFCEPGLEKDPMKATPMPDASSTDDARRNRMVLNERSKEAAHKVQSRITAKIVTERITLLPMFRDMDKFNKGVCTVDQFHRVMGMVKIPVTREECIAIAAQYCDRGNHQQMNYIEFIRQCDPLPESMVIANAQMDGPYQEQAPSVYFMDGNKVKPHDSIIGGY